MMASIPQLKVKVGNIDPPSPQRRRAPYNNQTRELYSSTISFGTKSTSLVDNGFSLYERALPKSVRQRRSKDIPAVQIMDLSKQLQKQLPLAEKSTLSEPKREKPYDVESVRAFMLKQRKQRILQNKAESMKKTSSQESLKQAYSAESVRSRSSTEHRYERKRTPQYKHLSEYLLSPLVSEFEASRKHQKSPTRVAKAREYIKRQQLESVKQQHLVKERKRVEKELISARLAALDEYRKQERKAHWQQVREQKAKSSLAHFLKSPQQLQRIAKDQELLQKEVALVGALRKGMESAALIENDFSDVHRAAAVWESQLAVVKQALEFLEAKAELHDGENTQQRLANVHVLLERLSTRVSEIKSSTGTAWAYSDLYTQINELANHTIQAMSNLSESSQNPVAFHSDVLDRSPNDILKGEIDTDGNNSDESNAFAQSVSHAVSDDSFRSEPTQSNNTSTIVAFNGSHRPEDESAKRLSGKAKHRVDNNAVIETKIGAAKPLIISAQDKSIELLVSTIKAPSSLGDGIDFAYENIALQLSRLERDNRTIKSTLESIERKALFQPVVPEIKLVNIANESVTSHHLSSPASVRLSDFASCSDENSTVDAAEDNYWAEEAKSAPSPKLEKLEASQEPKDTVNILPPNSRIFLAATEALKEPMDEPILVRVQQRKSNVVVNNTVLSILKKKLLSFYKEKGKDYLEQRFEPMPISERSIKGSNFTDISNELQVSVHGSRPEIVEDTIKSASDINLAPVVQPATSVLSNVVPEQGISNLNVFSDSKLSSTVALDNQSQDSTENDVKPELGSENQSSTAPPNGNLNKLYRDATSISNQLFEALETEQKLDAGLKEANELDLMQRTADRELEVSSIEYAYTKLQEELERELEAARAFTRKLALSRRPLSSAILGSETATIAEPSNTAQEAQFKRFKSDLFSQNVDAKKRVAALSLIEPISGSSHKSHVVQPAKTDADYSTDFSSIGSIRDVSPRNLVSVPALKDDALAIGFGNPAKLDFIEAETYRKDEVSESPKVGVQRESTQNAEAELQDKHIRSIGSEIAHEDLSAESLKDPFRGESTKSYEAGLQAESRDSITTETDFDDECVESIKSAASITDAESTELVHTVNGIDSVNNALPSKEALESQPGKYAFEQELHVGSDPMGVSKPVVDTASSVLESDSEISSSGVPNFKAGDANIQGDASIVTDYSVVEASRETDFKDCLSNSSDDTGRPESLANSISTQELDETKSVSSLLSSAVSEAAVEHTEPETDRSATPQFKQAWNDATSKVETLQELVQREIGPAIDGDDTDGSILTQSEDEHFDETEFFSPDSGTQVLYENDPVNSSISFISKDALPEAIKALSEAKDSVKGAESVDVQRTSDSNGFDCADSEGADVLALPSYDNDSFESSSTSAELSAAADTQLEDANTDQALKRDLNVLLNQIKGIKDQIQLQTRDSGAAQSTNSIGKNDSDVIQTPDQVMAKSEEDGKRKIEDMVSKIQQFRQAAASTLGIAGLSADELKPAITQDEDSWDFNVGESETVVAAKSAEPQKQLRSWFETNKDRYRLWLERNIKKDRQYQKADEILCDISKPADEKAVEFIYYQATCEALREVFAKNLEHEAYLRAPLWHAPVFKPPGILGTAVVSSCARIVLEEWSKYSVKYGENLDALLISQVRKEEFTENQKIQHYAFYTIKKHISSWIWDSMLNELIKELDYIFK